MKLCLFLSALLFSSIAAQASVIKPHQPANPNPTIECPSLEGSYACPGNSGYPDFTLNITQTLSDDKTSATYIYDYPGLGVDPVTVKASSSGELNVETDHSYWATCFNSTLFYVKQDNTNGSFQTTTINADGALYVLVKGKPAALCANKNKAKK